MVGLGRDSPYGIFYLKTINGNIIRKILENQNLRTLRVLFEVLISIEVIYNPQVSIRSNKLAGVGRAFKVHRILRVIFFRSITNNSNKTIKGLTLLVFEKSWEINTSEP